jgi:serine/threonine-protein kinase
MDRVPLPPCPADGPTPAQPSDKRAAGGSFGSSRTVVPQGVPHGAAVGRAPAPGLGDDLHDDFDPLQPSGLGPLSEAGLCTEGPYAVTIGGFHIVRKLGVGGFGAVYLARQQQPDRDVALKVMAREMASKSDFLHRFYREARTMETLDHPHIVRGFGPFEDRGWHCFAMEYVDGDNMRTWLSRLGRLKVGDALHIAIRCAQALEYAHDLNLVHRDIKPENVLVNRRGMVKVADLGLAKAMDEDLSLTRSGAGFGTPYYMAPEQARNAKHVDHRSDIYALGSTLYHLLTGHLPFKGETALELLLAKEHDPLVPARKYAPEIPERLDLILHKMLARSPQHRYQNCAALILDLDRLGLASPTLSFIRDEVAPGDTPLDTLPPLAATQKVDIAVQSPARPAADVADTWWQVRVIKPGGEPVVRQLTTRQLLERLKDPSFDIRATVRPGGEGAFRPLDAFPDFRAALLARPGIVSKEQADRRRAARLQRAYEQVEQEIAEKDRKRLEEQGENTPLPWDKIEKGIAEGKGWIERFVQGRPAPQGEEAVAAPARFPLSRKHLLLIGGGLLGLAASVVAARWVLHLLGLLFR